MRLFMVRHGHAGRKDQWHGADRLRPLDARGRREAVRLAELIAPHRPVRTVSSPHVRCLETMEPLAGRLGLEVERSRALVPDASGEALALVRALSAELSDAGIVVCTHGEVMGAVLTELAREDGVQLARKPPGLKGCLWTLEMRRGKLVAADYVSPGSTRIPAPAPGASVGGRGVAGAR